MTEILAPSPISRPSRLLKYWFRFPKSTYASGQPILRMTGVDGQHVSSGFALP